MSCNCHFLPEFVVNKIKNTNEKQHQGLRNSRLFTSNTLLNTLSNTFSDLTSRTGPQPVIDIGKNILRDCRNRNTVPGRLKGDDYIEIAETNDNDSIMSWNYTNSYLHFLKHCLNRESIDGSPSSIISSNVHYGLFFNNAFFDGQSMVYGDGDNVIFSHFAQDPTVIFHELTHGLVMHTSNLQYQGQSGALNESVADIFAKCCIDWMELRDIPSSWLIGDLCMKDYSGNKYALRSISHPGEGYINHPIIGSDPQVGHMKDYVEMEEDNGGVHIYSGIPNRAFYLFCDRIKEKIYEAPLKIWYNTLLDVPSDCDFITFATKTIEKGQEIDNKYVQPLTDSWNDVGIHF